LVENKEIQEKVAEAIMKEGYDAWKTMIGWERINIEEK
jgi:hypothetical protein